MQIAKHWIFSQLIHSDSVSWIFSLLHLDFFKISIEIYSQSTIKIPINRKVVDMVNRLSICLWYYLGIFENIVELRDFNSKFYNLQIKIIYIYNCITLTNVKIVSTANKSQASLCWLVIQSIYLLTLAKTVYRSRPLHSGEPQLTTPHSFHRSFFSHCNGPPLSPWQPLAKDELSL